MKYYFWILGCAMNYSDSERIATILNEMGYSRTMNESKADLFFVISCSVRQSAMNSIFGKVKDLNERKAKEPNFRTILSGCVLEKDKKKLKPYFDVCLEVKDLDKLPQLITGSQTFTDISATESVISTDLSVVTLRRPEAEKSLINIPKGSLQQGRDDKEGGTEYLSIRPDYESTFRANVPISTGCDNFCSYCAVPYTRGREKSRPADEIINEVQNLVKNGYKEITLLGQNVNSYGRDLKSTVIPANAGIDVDPRDKHEDDNVLFIKLLTVLDKIAGDHRIYFYSNHPKDMSDELITTLTSLKHFPRYIHLPLQSGNDGIMKKMNRHNTKKEYLELVKRIREAMPDVNLTTDIIVGFPGETEEMFQDTIDVMEKTEYDMAFIAQYSPRPGTVSAKLADDVSSEDKKNRAEILQEILVRTASGHNHKLIGTTQKVLVDEKKNGKYYGRTEGYKVVEITPTNYCSNEVRTQKPYSFQPASQPASTSLRGEQGGQASNNNTDQPLRLGQYVNVKIVKTERMKLIGTIN